MTEKVIRSACGMCHGACGILGQVRDGRVVKIEGDPDCPINKGSLCPQGLAAVQFIYHPDRLKYPLKRAGARGEGKWTRISWDEAMDTIASKVKEIREKYGPLGVAAGCGTARPVQRYVRRFLHVMGTPNRLGYPHNCMSPRVSLSMVIFGRFITHDPENSNCIVSWARNVTHTRGSRSGRLFIEGWKKGAKLISVDSYLTAIASKADIWLQVRPGTDGAMALAWVNVIIKENLYNKDFIAKWTTDFDRLAEHVEKFTPEWAEKITWVPADKIRAAARMYATNPPASVLIGVAPEFGISVTNTVHTLWLLPVLTGNVDIPGGNLFWEQAIPVPHQEKIQGTPLLTKDIWDKTIGGFPLLVKALPAPGHAGWNAILSGEPYPIKAVLFHSANPLVNHENPRGLVREALMKLDFISVMDHFMTPTAEIADIVLPASTCFERDDIHHVLETKYTVAAPKLIEPLWESKDDRDFFIDLLKRIGLDYGFGAVPELLDYYLEPTGMRFTEFVQKGVVDKPQRWKKYETGLMRRDRKPGFPTPSGKIELYSTELKDMDLDPLPVYKEPPDSPYSNPELAKSYPFVLSNAERSKVFFHSQYRQIACLREVHPDPIVKIHPQTAAQVGIKDGEWVYIESHRGRCKQKAQLTLGVDPRVVLAEHGWWFPEKKDTEHGVWDSNINLLVESGPPYDRGCGSTPARGLLCKIYKAEIA